MATETRTFSIPALNCEALRAEFARIEKRAIRLRVPAPTLTLDPTPRGRFFTATVTGETPVLAGGWELAAILTRVEGGNQINLAGRARTDGGVPVEYRTSQPLCDHCKANRKRNDTFLVTSEAGEWKQVGRNCLGDFLGVPGMNPTRIAALATMLSTAFAAGTAGEADSQSGGYPSTTIQWALEDVVAFSAAIINKFGFVSRNEVYHRRTGEATANTVLKHMRPTQPEMRELGTSRVLPTEKDREIADKAIAWASSIAVDGVSDFEHNMRLLAGHGMVDARALATAVFIVEGYWRAERIERARAEQHARLGSWIGEVGQRVFFKGTVVSTKATTNGSTLVVFRDSATEGMVKWFAPFALSPNTVLIPGFELSLEAIVKEHATWNSKRHTVVTNVEEVP